jgi:hypothetical protein
MHTRAYTSHCKLRQEPGSRITDLSCGQMSLPPEIKEPLLTRRIGAHACSRWDEIRLDVAHHIEGWMDAAIARAQPSSENDHDPSTDIDLAGR